MILSGVNRTDVYHHSDNDGPKIYLKVEKNSKGFNYEASVTGAKTVEEAIKLLKQAEKELNSLYGKSE